MKIYIFGKRGGGKTTLTKEISKNYDIPAIHLDFLRPRKDKKRYFEALHKIIKEDSWIIEGTWEEKYGARDIAEAADVMIWIDLDPETNYNNRLNRLIKKHGGSTKHLILWDSRFREVILSYKYDGAFHKEIWENHKGPKKKCESQWKWDDIKNFLNNECKGE